MNFTVCLSPRAMLNEALADGRRDRRRRGLSPAAAARLRTPLSAFDRAAAARLRSPPRNPFPYDIVLVALIRRIMGAIIYFFIMVSPGRSDECVAEDE